MVQNFANGQVDETGIEGLLASPALRRHFLDQLESFLVANHASGAVFDFEQLDRAGQFNYLQLLHEARPRFAAHGWLVTVAAPSTRIGTSGASRRCPTSCSSWLMTNIRTTVRRDRSRRSNGGRRSVAAAIRQIPRDKTIVTIGNYAYDWHDGTGDPENVEEAWVDAGDSDAPPDLRPHRRQQHLRV